jgi:mRNA-degrading endonuclease HigB of HigAB toxin-antitoxin module
VAWPGDGRRSFDGPSRAEALNQSYVLDTGILLNLVRGKELGNRIDREFGLSRAMRLHTISIVTHGRAKWKNSSDVKASYASASIIGADRVVFNIKGNAYRLVAAVDYGRAIVFIKWLGTHKEYDAVDVRTIQYAR